MVNTIESGRMFGELGLIYNRARAASCIALGEVELAKMGKNDYKNTLEKV